jgi:putative sterol carrier protein
MSDQAESRGPKVPASEDGNGVAGANVPAEAAGVSAAEARCTGLEEGVRAGAPASSSRQSAQPSGPRGASDIRQLILGEIYDRGARANRKLKTQLSSLIQLNVTDLGQSYLFDWQGNELKVEERRVDAADCNVSLGSAELLAIAGGDLNPQIAMLSDKVKVTGKAGMAVYLFNLFAPKVEH